MDWRSILLIACFIVMCGALGWAVAAERILRVKKREIERLRGHIRQLHLAERHQRMMGARVPLARPTDPQSGGYDVGQSVIQNRDHGSHT
jgi:hypothetical protein